MVAGVCQCSDGLEQPFLCRCDEPNLLTDQLGLSHVGISIPFANEKFSQERIEWFLLAPQLFTATAVLLAERGEEPSENSQGSLFRICLLSRGNEYRWMFGPVRRILRQGSGGENEWWSSQRGKVSVEGRDRLREMKSHRDQPRSSQGTSFTRFKKKKKEG